MIDTNKESVFDVVYKVLTIFYKDSVINTKLKSKLIKDFSFVLNKGYTVNEVYNVLNEQYKINKSSLPCIKKLITKNKEGNLINPLKLYIHNELIITSSPPMLEFDPIKGEIIEYKSRYFLEPLASYSIDDLYNYYTSKENIFTIPQYKERDYKILKWLVEKYTVEQVLFMIDACDLYSNGFKKIKSPFDLQDFIAEGINLKDAKFNNVSINNMDKIVFKKRKKI